MIAKPYIYIYMYIYIYHISTYHLLGAHNLFWGNWMILSHSHIANQCPKVCTDPLPGVDLHRLSLWKWQPPYPRIYPTKLYPEWFSYFCRVYKHHTHWITLNVTQSDVWEHTWTWKEEMTSTVIICNIGTVIMSKTWVLNHQRNGPWQSGIEPATLDVYVA